jgi:hypothetical protein
MTAQLYQSEIKYEVNIFAYATNWGTQKKKTIFEFGVRFAPLD